MKTNKNSLNISCLLQITSLLQSRKILQFMSRENWFTKIIEHSEYSNILYNLLCPSGYFFQKLIYQQYSGQLRYRFYIRNLPPFVQQKLESGYDIRSEGSKFYTVRFKNRKADHIQLSMQISIHI